MQWLHGQGTWPCGALMALALSVASQTGAQPSCPAGTSIGGLPGARFADGSFGVIGPLAVNPDGAKASYTVGDHGITYVANGMDRWNPKLSCQSSGAGCGTLFREAEKRDFGPGTAEFCVYAIEVEPIAPATATVDCGEGKRVIGNGKGRPRKGADQLEMIDGGKTSYYQSMTHLNQLVDGTVRSIDSATVPAIVVPSGSADLLRPVVYVTYQGRATLAAVGDTGRRFGEGSVALHELLRYGALPAGQRAGRPVRRVWGTARAGRHLRLRRYHRRRHNGGARQGTDTNEEHCVPGARDVGCVEVGGRRRWLRV